MENLIALSRESQGGWRGFGVVGQLKLIKKSLDFSVNMKADHDFDTLIQKS